MIIKANYNDNDIKNVLNNHNWIEHNIHSDGINITTNEYIFPIKPFIKVMDKNNNLSTKTRVKSIIIQEWLMENNRELKILLENDTILAIFTLSPEYNIDSQISLTFLNEEITEYNNEHPNNKIMKI